MRFYNRENELKELSLLWGQATQSAKMAVLVGRRRIGKTLLSLEFARGQKALYFFVEKKSEALLCEEWLKEIREKFPLPFVGVIKTFKELFKLLLELSKTERIILILDEFQEFLSINRSVFSEIQHLWDLYKANSQLFAIFIGSVYSMMRKIFQDAKEPLFGRADRILTVESFSIKTLFLILKDHQASELKQLFDFYVVTGGMPKYIDMLLTNQVNSFAMMKDFMLRDFSPFLEEGKFLLIEEFGRDYATYFSILELISLGKTSRPEIESILERNVGGYIERLEQDYAVITRAKPFDCKPSTRLVRFSIKDHFLNFWFRFFYRNRNAIEAKNFQYVKEIIQRDYSTYCGRYLENFFAELILQSGAYNRLGSWWEKGNLNEIDIVAANDLKKELLIAEVKTNEKNFSLSLLQQKATVLVRSYSDYQIKWKGLSLKDATDYLT